MESTLESILKHITTPENYMEHNNENKRYIQLIIDKFKDKLKDISGKCMDVGCGPGDSTLELLLPSLHPNATLIGTDNDKKMIEYARTYYSKSERLQFEEMDIEKDLYEKYINTFDHIFSFHTLHWCSDIKQALRNIHRMLRLGGTLLLCYRMEGSLYDIFKTLTNDTRFASCHVNYEKFYMQDQKHFVLKTDVKEFLERIGFHVHTYYHEPDYCLIEELKLSLSIDIKLFIDPLITNLPNNLQIELKKQLQEKLMKNSIDPNVDNTLRRNLIGGDRAVVFAKKK